MNKMELEKARMMSLDMTQENIKKIADLFPNVVTEVADDNGESKLLVDFDALKQELSNYLISEKQDRYQMTWPDKKKSIILANKSVVAALRPVPERSIDFNSTKNVYIEGDNLDVLKLLRETYLGKVKMIYIDPPYNTGTDFVYADDRSQTEEDYLILSGQYDEQGNRLFQNAETNGRFHTDWLNLMYPRLKVARDLLTDDGFICISIDEHEINNLRKICDEIFGEQNFLLNICVNRTSEIASNFTVSKHEYLAIYVKNNNDFKLQTIEKYTISRGTVGNANQTQPVITFPAGLECKNIKDGVYTETRKIDGSNENIINLDPIVVENGKLKNPVRLQARWRSSNDMRNFFANDCKPTKAKINGEIAEIYFENDRFNPQIKKKTYEKIPSMYLENKRGSEDLKKLDMEGLFDFPKSVSYMKYLLSFTEKDDLIMDFFSGSGTMAQAVYEINAEKGETRNYILVQLPEDLDENLKKADGQAKETVKKAIEFCDKYGWPHLLTFVSEERIRRASKKTLEELAHLTNAAKAGAFEEEGLFAYAEFTNSPKASKTQEDLRKIFDFGFRVFSLSSSNMNEVFYNPKEMTQSLLEATIDNVRPDRNSLDLLFQVMLECGAMLSSKIEEMTINGKKIFVVEDNYIAACFENEVDDKTVEAIAKLHPVYACFKGSSFNSDSANINAEQIFKTYSPNTEKIKVI